MSEPLFDHVPRYNLPTIVPFTFRDAYTLLEQLENIRAALVEIQRGHNTLSDTILKLVDDTNNAVESALRNVVHLTADYRGLLDEMEEKLSDQLAEVTEIANRLSHALEIANKANENYSAAIRRLNELAARLGVVEHELTTKVGKNDWVYDVRDHGAVGDGKTDDTAAIKATIAAAMGDKEKWSTAIVFFPRGVYVTSETIDVPTSIIIKGIGDFPMWKFTEEGSVLKYMGDGAALNCAKTVTIDGMNITGVNSVGNSIGIRAHESSAIDIRDTTVAGFGTALRLFKVWYGSIRDVCFIENKHAGDVEYCYNTNFWNCRVACYTDKELSQGDGFSVTAESMVAFHGGAIEGFKNYAIKCDSGITLSCFGTYFETSPSVSTPVANCIDLNDAKMGNVNIVGCQVYVTNMRSFVNISRHTGSRVTAIGNTFKGGRAGQNTHIYRISPEPTAWRGVIMGDALRTVNDKSGQLKYISYMPTNSTVKVPYGANFHEGFNSGVPLGTKQWVTMGNYTDLPSASAGKLERGAMVWWNKRGYPVFWNGSRWVKADGSDA